MAKFQIRKRDNSMVGHGDWSVVEQMGNAFVSHWVEIFQGSHDRCEQHIRTLCGERAAPIGPRDGLSPSTVDVSCITEYGLTQKLTHAVRCF